MQEEIVSFQVAKLAKEKGLQFGCKKSYCEYHSSYEYDGDKTHPESYEKGDVRLDNFFTVNNYKNLDLSNEHFTIYEAPTQSLLQRWLREVHRIYVYIKPIHNLDINGSMLDNWEICIEDFMGRKSLEESIYIHGYEEALEIGLQETLKLIKED